MSDKAQYIRVWGYPNADIDLTQRIFNQGRLKKDVNTELTEMNIIHYKVIYWIHIPQLESRQTEEDIISMSYTCTNYNVYNKVIKYLITF